MRLAHDFSIWLNLKTSDFKKVSLYRSFWEAQSLFASQKLKIKHFWGYFGDIGYSKSILALMSQIWLLSNKSTIETLVSYPFPVKTVNL